jgi:hypothetical protein
LAANPLDAFTGAAEMNDQEAWEEIGRLEGYVSCLEAYGQKHIGQINAARARISALREQVAVEPSTGPDNDETRTSGL